MLDPGATLGGRYTLVELIARGGMGEVWRADDGVLGRRVAVKALLPGLAGDPGFAARFRAEARAMAALSHPGIVEIYDYGHADGVAYLVMQFVEGRSLSELVRRDGPLEPWLAMRLLAQAAEAIHAAHTQGIVHRDVKPSNLLLRPDGRLALTDFGIARIVAGDRLTAADEILGTASYLAPEQVTGDHVGPATDVYALGVVAYELLTGTRPFVGDAPMDVALQHVHDDPPELPASLPQPLRDLVRRALAKDPHDRWPTAAALARAARAAGRDAPSDVPGAARPSRTAPVLGAPPPRPATSAAGPSPLGESATPARPRRLLAVAAAAGAALAAVAAFVLLPSGGDDPQAHSTAATSAAAPPTTGPTPGSAGTGAPSAATPSRRAPSATPGRVGTTATPVSGNPAATSPAAPSNPAPATRKVPAMYGWREVEVTAELSRLGLVARITYRSTPDKCYAIEQTPTGGTVVDAGSPVDVVIATATGVCEQV